MSVSTTARAPLGTRSDIDAPILQRLSTLDRFLPLPRTGAGHITAASAGSEPGPGSATPFHR